MARYNALSKTVLSMATVTAVLASPIAADARGGPNDETGHTQVTVCHATSSPTNPYVEIVVDDDGTYGGHGDHMGDLLGVVPGTCPTGTDAGGPDAGDPIDEIDELDETLPEDQGEESTDEGDQSSEDDSSSDEDGDDTADDEESTDQGEDSTNETDTSDDEETVTDETDETTGDDSTDGTDNGDDGQDDGNDQGDDTSDEDSGDEDQDDISEDDTDDSDTDGPDDLDETNDADLVARNDSATVEENNSVVIAVLPNDSASDLAGELAVTVVGGPSNGTAELITDGSDAGKIRYTPNAAYVGADEFPYTITDGTGGTASALVTITVTPLDGSEEIDETDTDETMTDETDDTDTDESDETDDTDTDETQTDETDETGTDSDETDDVVTTLPNTGAGQFAGSTSTSGQLLLLLATLTAALGAWLRRMPLQKENAR